MSGQMTCAECRRFHSFADADDPSICTARIVEYDRGYGDGTYGCACPTAEPEQAACGLFEQAEEVGARIERLDAVARLRGYALDEMEPGGILPTLRRALGVDGTWRSVMLRLADLIDGGGR